MYKIYINEKPLLLMKTSEMQGLSSDMETNLVSHYAGNTKILLNIIDLLEKTADSRAIIVYAEDVKALWRDFKGLYHKIRAAGGLVYNPDGEVLTIYRRGFWDLPKGKIDPGEGKREAAVREVAEETGLKDILLEHKLMHTWHTYRDERKNRRVLKKTYWYRMSAPNQDLVPQTEEDIEQALWMQPVELKARRPIYNTILEVLDAK